MEQESQVVAEVRERMAAWMQEIFGTMARPRQDGAGLRVHFGSAFVDVSVSGWGANEAVVLTSAEVVSGAELTPELLRWLLDKNCEMRFGAYGITPSGDIEFRHAIVGSTCQKEELKASVQYVMLVADLADDQIVARWGGKRAVDREP